MTVLHCYEPTPADLQDYLARTLPVVMSIHKPQLSKDWGSISHRLSWQEDGLPRLYLLITDRNQVAQKRQSYSASLVGTDLDRDKALRALFGAAVSLSNGRDVRLDFVDQYLDPAIRRSLDFPFMGVWLREHHD